MHFFLKLVNTLFKSWILSRVACLTGYEPQDSWILSRVACLTGYEPQDLIEKTLYQFIHAGDMVPMRLTHLTCKSNIFFEISNIWNYLEIRNILIKIKNITRCPTEHDYSKTNWMSSLIFKKIRGVYSQT